VESTSVAADSDPAEDATSTDGSTSASATAGTTTSTETTASESSGADESSTGDAPPSVCDPQPEMIDVDVDFDIEFASGDGEIILDAGCVVEAIVQEESTRLRIDLSCDELGEQVSRKVFVTSDPPVALPIGPTDALQLRVAEVVPIDTGGYECVALHDADGALVLGQYHAGCPDELVDPATWLAPFVLELRMDVCEPEPYVRPDGGAFIQDPCPGQDQRGAFTVDDGVESVLVYDRGTGVIAGVDVRVPKAIRHYPIEAESCGPGPYDEARIVLQRPAR
jgi:hypothetical protein